MRGQGKQSTHDETALNRAVRHPKRLEMLGYLAGSKTGMEEVELADALGLTPPLVKYHLGVLESADLVAHVEDSAPGTTDRYVVAIAGA
jgi:DNA-binding transcriptional ArsR family regulator